MTVLGRTLALAVAAAFCQNACLNLDDVPVTEGISTADAGGGMSDAAAPDGDAGIPMTPCNHCIYDEGAPCRADYDTCAKNAKCAEIVHCATARNCMSLADLSKIIPCAQVCIDQAGITSSSDPATLAAAPLFYCTKDATKCADVCSR
ncbi:MAG TPA: hypothetical protein VHE30_28070 [Polyangiaceae bacterium]|nr:hypothetical protein [Polyangiaceae bacterium]